MSILRRSSCSSSQWGTSWGQTDSWWAFHLRPDLSVSSAPLWGPRRCGVWSCSYMQTSGRARTGFLPRLIKEQRDENQEKWRLTPSYGGAQRTGRISSTSPPSMFRNRKHVLRSQMWALRSCLVVNSCLSGGSGSTWMWGWAEQFWHVPAPLYRLAS